MDALHAGVRRTNPPSDPLQTPDLVRSHLTPGRKVIVMATLPSILFQQSVLG